MSKGSCVLNFSKSSIFLPWSLKCNTIVRNHYKYHRTVHFRLWSVNWMLSKMIVGLLKSWMNWKKFLVLTKFTRLLLSERSIRSPAFGWPIVTVKITSYNYVWPQSSYWFSPVENFACTQKCFFFCFQGSLSKLLMLTKPLGTLAKASSK